MTVKEIYGTDFPVILAPMAGCDGYGDDQREGTFLWE